MYAHVRYKICVPPYSTATDWNVRKGFHTNRASLTRVLHSTGRWVAAAIYVSGIFPLSPLCSKLSSVYSKPRRTKLDKVHQTPAMEDSSKIASRTNSGGTVRANDRVSPISGRGQSQISDFSRGNSSDPVSPVSGAIDIEDQQQEAASKPQTCHSSTSNINHTGSQIAPFEKAHSHVILNTWRQNGLFRHFRGLCRVLRYPWLLEVFSCLVACTALFGIIITLYLHEGRPLPQWPSMISINSLIAIFTAIFKAAILLPIAEGTILLSLLF